MGTHCASHTLLAAGIRGGGPIPSSVVKVDGGCQELGQAWSEVYSGRGRLGGGS